MCQNATIHRLPLLHIYLVLRFRVFPPPSVYFSFPYSSFPPCHPPNSDAALSAVIGPLRGALVLPARQRGAHHGGQWGREGACGSGHCEDRDRPWRALFFFLIIIFKISFFFEPNFSFLFRCWGGYCDAAVYCYLLSS